MKVGTLCYIRDKNKTLMIHRVKKENDFHEGKYNGLGGKIDPGESPEDCIIREVFEESGLRIHNPYLKGILTFPTFDGIDDWYVFVFVVTEFEGDLLESSPEGNLEWIETDKLYDLNLWDGDSIFMEWLDRKEFFSAKFTYNNGRLVEHEVNFY